jgi:hypothetical protein
MFIKGMRKNVKVSINAQFAANNTLAKVRLVLIVAQIRCLGRVSKIQIGKMPNIGQLVLLTIKNNV